MTYLKSKRKAYNLDDYSTKLEAEIKFLNVSGDVMNGDLNMQGNKIINLPEPTEETEPCSKKFCEANFLSLTGNAMKGDLNMQRNKIINLPEPTSSAEACTKKYCDDLLVNYNPYSEYLIRSPNCIKLKTNICMDGKKIFNLAKPTDLRQAANKEYVDEIVPKIIPFKIDTREQNLNISANKILFKILINDPKLEDVTNVNQLVINIFPKFGNICYDGASASLPELHVSTIALAPLNNIKHLQIGLLITSCGNTTLSHFTIDGFIFIMQTVAFAEAEVTIINTSPTRTPSPTRPTRTPTTFRANSDLNNSSNQTSFDSTATPHPPFTTQRRNILTEETIRNIYSPN